MSAERSMFGNRNATEKDRAYEDFVRCSLDPLPTGWARAVFASGLGRKSGEPYRHWGLEKDYGVAEVRAALRRAHEAEIRKILDSGYFESVRSIQAFAASHGQSADSSIDLVSPQPEYLPEGLTRAERMHIAVELETLKLLCQRSAPSA